MMIFYRPNGEFLTTNKYIYSNHYFLTNGRGQRYFVPIYTRSSLMILKQIGV